jgi:hypothetical protein
MLGSQYGMNYVAELQANSKKPVVATKHETRKTSEISIPKIRNGIVRGYVVVRLNYVVDAGVLATVKVSPDVFISDELFKYVYSDETINFEHLENYDVKKLTTSLIESINARLDAKVISDIGVQEFNFIAAADGRKRPN